MRFLLLFLLAFLAACDNSETITAPDKKDTVATVASGINLSGKVNLSNAGGLDASSISVSVAGIVVHPKDDGTWTLTGSVPKVAARASSVLDTVKIIVAGDTLVEVPVESWDAILPTNYIVQRNVGVVVPKKFAGNKVQAVFWDNDSIARVLGLGTGTAKWKFSGFIYTAYNDSQFMENSKLYDIFVRVKRNDSVVAYTEISEVTAKVGNLDFDSTQFSESINHIRYLYTFVPNDSNLKNWNDTVVKSVVFDTIFDTIALNTNISVEATNPTDSSKVDCIYGNATSKMSNEITYNADSSASFSIVGFVTSFQSLKDTLVDVGYLVLVSDIFQDMDTTKHNLVTGKNTIVWTIPSKTKLTAIDSYHVEYIFPTNVISDSGYDIRVIMKRIVKHYI